MTENNVNSPPLSPKHKFIIRHVLGEDIEISDNSISSHKTIFPIINGVIKFRTDSGYATSFAKQWNKFQLNQYDSVNGTNLYRDRYLRETRWAPRGLDGEFVLEAGCGAGAFTCHLLKTGCNLVAIDYGHAVDIAKKHNCSDRGIFAQADILDMPFVENCFDRVFCHGVIQHTPNPKETFKALTRVLKPGGKISIDVYIKDGRVETWKAKYLWRWLSTRVSQDKLMSFLEFFIPYYLPFDTIIKKIPQRPNALHILGRYLGAVIPCMNYWYTTLTKEEKINWAVMNTFDALSPKYDNPVKLEEVQKWFEDEQYENFVVRLGGNGVVGNGVK